MFLSVEKRVAEAFAAAVKSLYGIDIAVQTEQPKQSSFGEISVSVPFQLAKPLKKSPRAVADELSKAVGNIEGVASIEIAGAGFLNVRLDRGAYGAAALASDSGADARTAEKIPSGEKVIVEHTNINPNKAAHIGHLRNAILGDTFVRMLRSVGNPVEVQNYIDNTGVQVADVVVGFLHLEHKSAEDVQAAIVKPRFDYLCWDVYTRI